MTIIYEPELDHMCVLPFADNHRIGAIDRCDECGRYRVVVRMKRSSSHQWRLIPKDKAARIIEEANR